MKPLKLVRVFTIDELKKISKNQLISVSILPFFGKIVEVNEWEVGDISTYITDATGEPIWIQIENFEVLSYKILDPVVYTPKEEPSVKISAFVKGFVEDQIQIICKDETSENLVIRNVPYDSLQKIKMGGNSQ